MLKITIFAVLQDSNYIECFCNFIFKDSELSEKGEGGEDKEEEDKGVLSDGGGGKN